jgi:hypothetical protein
LYNTKSFKKDKSVTFPQADKFVRIVDLLDRLYVNEEPITKEEITIESAFDGRQADYYTSAGIYLGLIEKLKPGFVLTEKCREIMKLDPKRKNLELVRAILSHRVFNIVLGEYLMYSEKPSRERIINIMNDNLDSLSPTTIARRAQTVEKWVDWILQLTTY